MRKTLKIVIASLILLCTWGVSGVLAQSGTERPFITKWQGTKGEELKIPIIGTYKMVIKDGNGNEKINTTVTVADAGHPYRFTPMEDGTYTVEAGPEGVKSMQMRSDGWSFPTSNDKLLEVVQFGMVKWESMKEMFKMCKNMTFSSEIDTPDLSEVTDMEMMFAGCSSFNQPLGNWDVSKVTNMMGMFYGCSSFNQPLDNWNVSKVAGMETMFYGCSSFNQPLNHWEVSKVTDMEEMFRKCSAFNQPLNKWNVSNVTDMHNMFYECSAFNQPLNEWNVSNVTSMWNMFNGCSSFNQPLDNWEVSNVTDMIGMFSGCSSFNQPLNKWTVSNVTSMRSMFSDCSAFNQPLNHWTVSNVTSMGGMFNGCSAFNQPLNSWNVSNVLNMEEMFEDCRSFNQPLGKWDVRNVENMEKMFSGCTSFNKPLNKWEVSNVKNMERMFAGCSSFNKPLNHWKVDKVKDMSLMFWGCSSFNQPLGSWKIKTAVGGLDKTAMSPSNYSQTLVGWAEQMDIAENLDFYVEGLIYNDEGKAARQKLTGKGWKFEGDTHQSSGVAITPRSLLLVLNKECTLPLEKWGVEETEEVTLSTDTEEIISYEWTADKKGVHIKGLKEGKCQLTATIAAKAGVHDAYTSTCEIGVYIPIERITISPASKTLKVGEEFTFTVNFFPENATKREVEWVSDDSGIATVDNNGKVIAKAAGTCTVYAKINEYGHWSYGKCEVTVVNAIAPVASITLPEKQTLTVGTIVPLIAVVKPDNAEQGLVWSSSAPAIATVSEGVVWGKKTGECTITVKSLDPNCSITKECKITVEEPSNGGNQPTFTVTLTQHTNGRIAIEGYETSVTVKQGTTVTVTVTPDEGYKLKSLTADDEDITNSKQFTVMEDTEVKAVFEKETFKVNEKIVGSGALNFTDAEGQPLDLGAVPYGTTVKVVPVENTPWELVSLMVENEDITTSRSFVLKSEVTVYAVFQNKNVPTFKVNVTQTEGGTIDIPGYTKAALKKVSKDTELTVTVTPDTEHGYKLKELKVGDEDITAIKKFTVKADTEVKAVFELLTFQITPEVTGEGCSLTFKNAATDAPITDLGAVPYGTTVKVVPVPKEGWELKALSANGKDIFAAKEFIIKEATTVKAVFEKSLPKFAVTLTQPTNGKIAIEGHGTETSITVAQGTTLTVTVTPEEGYKLKSLKAGDEDITNTKQFTVKAATEVKAVFENKQGGAVEDALLAGIVVAPNPFSAQLRILNPEGVAARYEVVNGAGVVVRSGALSGSDVIVDTEALPAGIYFVRLEAQNGARKSVMVSK